VRPVARQRVLRVAEGVREAAAEILRALKDPRVGFATVVRAEVSPDLRHVWIHVSILGPEAEAEATMAALERARGHVRTELGRRVRLYHTPEVHFVRDGSIAHGDRIARLLAQLGREREAEAAPPDGVPGGGEAGLPEAGASEERDAGGAPEPGTGGAAPRRRGDAVP
jgi:ribosome-binding factor A